MTTLTSLTTKPKSAALEALAAIKAKLAVALEAYRANANLLPEPELRPLSDAVKALKKELSDTIAFGADPCPACGGLPHGMEQPGSRPGASEFEIGCLNHECTVVDHEDGTQRTFRARGGLLPSHAVDAWNAGPSFWLHPRAE